MKEHDTHYSAKSGFPHYNLITISTIWGHAVKLCGIGPWDCHQYPLGFFTDGGLNIDKTYFYIHENHDIPRQDLVIPILEISLLLFLDWINQLVLMKVQYLV